MEELERCSCIRGYHVYKNKWDPVVGEVLAYKRESTNAQDKYAVAAQKNGTIVGQLPGQTPLRVWKSVAGLKILTDRHLVAVCFDTSARLRASNP